MRRVRIGLEVHVYLRTRSKLFCPCSADFLAAAAPNAQVCPTCTAQPGAKPYAPNAAAVEGALLVAEALGFAPAPAARFLRKHYFYPDSPASYQRTSEPIGTGGRLAGVSLTELHLEEDPGAYDPAAGSVDFNRAGAPLVEIVTEPELASPAHARDFLGELRLVLDYLGVARAEAGVKADANVSLEGGERVEVKNVNSARNVERALLHEIERQAALLDAGRTVLNETRHFDEARGVTLPLRAKESAADYRFMGDPDLPPLPLAAARASLPRFPLPLARRAELAARVGLLEAEVSPLFEERALVDAFDQAARQAPPRVAFDFLVRDVRGELGFRGVSFAASRLDTSAVAALVAALAEGRVTPHVATRLLRRGLDEGSLLDALREELAHAAPPEDVMGEAARRVVAENPKAVQDYRGGKQGAVNFLVGQLMRRLQGRADAAAARAAVEAALDEAR